MRAALIYYFRESSCGVEDSRKFGLRASPALGTAPQKTVTRCARGGCARAAWNSGDDLITNSRGGVLSTFPRKSVGRFPAHGPAVRSSAPRRSRPRDLPATLRGALLSVLAAVALAGCECGVPPRTAIPEIEAHRFATPPTLDGELDDWGDAAATETFVDTITGAPSEPRARAMLGWDDAFFYVAFEIDDPYLRSAFDANDDHTWEEDCAELMIDPDGDGLGYVELQVAPTEVTFDTWFDSRRQPQPFGHIEWSSGLEARVHAEGVVGDQVADDGYVVEARIPWGALAVGPLPTSGPPRVGDTYRVALYVLDARAEGQYGVAWSAPMVSDFHVPDRFGRVTFSE